MKRVLALAVVLAVVMGIASVALAQTTGSVLYATEPVNMRSGPAASYPVLTVLNTGSAVQYYGTIGDWHQVVYNGLTGFVNRNYLSAAQTQAQAGTGSYALAKANLNVRTGPSTKYAVIGTFKKGETAAVLSASGNWYKIQIGASTGYVHKNYVSLTSVALPTQPALPSYPSVPSYQNEWGWTLNPGYSTGNEGSKWSSPNAYNPIYPGYSALYPTYPGYPVYPGYTTPDTSAANAFFSKLQSTGYFTTNAHIYLGKFVDDAGIPVVRVTYGTDLNRVANDIKSLLGKVGTFRITGSGMPAYVNEAYINSVLARISQVVRGFSTWQKDRCPVMGWGYDAKNDTIIVQIDGLSADKIEYFKKNVIDWTYIQFTSNYGYGFNF